MDEKDIVFYGGMIFVVLVSIIIAYFATKKSQKEVK